MFNTAHVINGLLFQTVWFACVLGGAYGLFWPGVLVVLALIVTVANTPSLHEDVLLAIVLMPVGWLLDTAWIQLGILDFHGMAVAPSWIVLMWLGVALTVNHSLSYFRDRPRIGAAAVMFAAPLSYLAGERLGAVVVPGPKLLALISVSWAVLFYLVFRYASQRRYTWSETLTEQ